MNEFVRYYMDFLITLWNNIVKFFRSLFSSIGELFGTDIKGYFNSLNEFSKYFTILDWMMAILVIVINVTFVILLLIRLFQLLRKYIKFQRTEITKDKLLDEITVLSQKLVEVTNEKNQILTLKMENLGLYTKQKEDKEAKTSQAKDKSLSRFSKLIDVDNEYGEMPYNVIMGDTDLISLKDLVMRFINFSASQLGLFYEPETIRVFFAGMSATNLLILEGISGTGKTSLPYAMGQFFKNPADIISVQPSWRDRSEMLGYLNEFTKKFNESDFLKVLYEGTYRDDMNFIVLDEMNLARIEYYFAEFLSIMEMPNHSDWLIEVVQSSDPHDPLHIVGGKILISPNIWFVGTANKDDSTFTITDKVYDRASIIEMNAKIEKVDAPHTDAINMSYEYLNTLFKEARSNYKMSAKSNADLKKLDDFVTDKFRITFGNRIMKQIRDFLPVYMACGGSEIDGLDYMVARKILRKFEALNLPFLVEELRELIVFIQRLFGKTNFKTSIEFIESLLKQV